MQYLGFRVLTRDLVRWLTAPIGLACPQQPCLPPPVSPAPTSLSCPHRPRLPLSASLVPVCLASPHGGEEGSALVLGIGLRPWQSALGFPSLSFISRSKVFLLFGSTDNSSSSLLLYHLLVSTSGTVPHHWVAELLAAWEACHQF
jgi:hypothetical protein